MKHTHSTLCTALRCAYHLFLWLALILLGKEYLSLSASQTWLENYLSEHYTEFYIAHSVSWGPQLACALAVQIPVDWCVHSRISGAPILK